MKKLILLLLFVQSFSYSQDISLDDLLNIRSIPEFKLLAFENSFVLNKTSESKTNFIMNQVIVSVSLIMKSICAIQRWI